MDRDSPAADRTTPEVFEVPSRGEPRRTRERAREDEPRARRTDEQPLLQPRPLREGMEASAAESNEAVVRDTYRGADSGARQRLRARERDDRRSRDFGDDVRASDRDRDDAVEVPARSAMSRGFDRRRDSGDARNSVDFDVPREGRLRARDRDTRPLPRDRDSIEGRRFDTGRDSREGSVDAPRGNPAPASLTASLELPTQSKPAAPPLLRARDAESLPEVHFIGEIVGGSGFGTGVSCKWAFEFGDKWEWLQGDKDGQTQTDYPEDDSGDSHVIWSHPLDAHLIAGSLHGWPRVLVQVWQLDDAGRADIAGYGYCNLPTIPGCHKVSCATWRPVGTERQELSGYLLGGRPQLKTSSVISVDSSQRFNLTTVASGTVHFEISVIMKNFDKLGFE